jgi:hypothetical protein
MSNRLKYNLQKIPLGKRQSKNHLSAMNARLPLLFLLLTTACDRGESDNNSPFKAGRILGTNLNKHLEETSGIAASRRHPGLLWAHNDSGHKAELFLLDTLAQTKTMFQIEDAKNRDWEDIAVGPGRDSTNYIYIGDIGDNLSKHHYKFVYCVKEPPLDYVGPLPVEKKLIIKMSDQARDTEALMVDPISRNLYLVTKREHEVWLYEIRNVFEGDTLTAFKMHKLDLRHVVAADISAEGSEILIKSYDAVYYWKRSPGQSIPDALKADPLSLAYKPEMQGESIAWALDGSGYYTLSENAKGERARLLFYKRKKVHEENSAKKD